MYIRARFLNHRGITSLTILRLILIASRQKLKPKSSKFKRAENFQNSTILQCINKYLQVFFFRTMYLKESNVTESDVNASTNAPSTDLPRNEENMFWILMDCFLFVAIVLGNVLTILAITWARRLRNVVSNYFILNLAVSDLMVGVTLPYHLAFYADDTLHRNKSVCISRFIMFSLACGGSIYNLIIIAIDRYVAIVYPLSYNAYATKRRVLLIIIVAWICTMGVSSIPTYWNNFDASNADQKCELETVLPRYYILAIQMPALFLSWIAMFLLYWKIWREAHMHARRMNLGIVPNIAEKNDRKSVQVVLLILGCFSICWFPYFVVVCIRMHTSDWRTNSMTLWYKSTFALAVANSAMNPFIYAWKNTNFRKAFLKILHFKSPNDYFNSSFKMYLEKQRQLKSQTDVQDSHRTNGNNNSPQYSPNPQSDHAEENRTENTIF
ncbi:D(3) dopamine receptor isoform X1 [Temnothorax curvispinosus]|uniref:D(3) dopamine receptor isoform X1 n=1 Tax=Temnothorax curvispinosus TaxID=300111 RepID=A0A6J1Q6W0_9HYME|nr:D(3) dopamine receptor isoform X1 [Temnothorax curvispinosus]XP_024877418.1 D(3) dopamine receptor isoform X1 [Temnothorax curvispinosus]